MVMMRLKIDEPEKLADVAWMSFSQKYRAIVLIFVLWYRATVA